MQTTMCPARARWMMPRSPAITASACAVVSTMQIVRSALAATSAGEGARAAPRVRHRSAFDRIDVVDHEREAALDEVERHRIAHGAETDESDCAGHCRHLLG